MRIWELIKSKKDGGVDGGSDDEDGGDDESDGDGGAHKKWVRVRCVLRIRHQRSEDAPVTEAAVPSDEQELMDRLKVCGGGSLRARDEGRARGGS